MEKINPARKDGALTPSTMMDNRRHHMVRLQATQGEIPIEISIPNYAFRNLDLSVGKIVQVALREESLWVMT